MSAEFRNYVTLCENCNLRLFGVTAPENFSRGQFHLLDYFWLIKYYEDKYKNSPDADVVIPE